MKNNAFAIISLLLAMGPVLGACSSKESGKGELKAGEAPTFTLLMNDGVTKYPHEVNQGENPYLKELRKLSGYNVQFEILPANDYQDKMTVRFASGDLADLVYVNNIDWPIKGAVDNKVLMELGPLIDQYAPNIKKNVPEEMWKSPDLSKNGKIYATPRVPAVGTASSGGVMYIRQDWLDKLKMKTPVTIDDWLAYFDAVKKNDMNGNGKQDEYGVMLYSATGYSSPFFGQYGVFPSAWTYINGQLIPDMIRPEMKEAIKFYRLLVEKGYAPPDWMTIPSANRDGMIYRGEVGSWRHDITNLNGLWNKKNFLDPNVKLDVIDGPTGPNGKKGLQPQMNGTGPVWAIPAKSKHVVDVMKFLNWAWSDEAMQLFSLGVEGINYTKEKNGKINFDPAAPANSQNDGMIWNQAILGGLRADMRLTKAVIDTTPNPEAFVKGIEVAKRNAMSHDSQNMPVLNSYVGKPDLVPGLTNGTLFYDMFAKVVTGQLQLDPAFDDFSKAWRSRGGEEMIKEATAWYKSYRKIN